MTKIIRARNVKTVRNIDPKLSSQMSGPGCGFMVLDLKSWIPGPGYWLWVLSLNSWVLGPGSWVDGPGSWVPVHSVLVTKSDKKLFQSVTSITKCDSYYKV